ncbi:MAG: hypothetical protein LH603_00610 [Pseudonocardia sp.]|nr:hypothetical protein [Pseudonocardia sp.]
MRCALCGWPRDETAVLSTHHTSEGWVRYRRCACGAVSIELVTLDDRRALRTAVVA